MAAVRAPNSIRVLALVILVLSLSARSGTTFLRGRRSLWDGQSFQALRNEANGLFTHGKYSEAADAYSHAYKQAIAKNDKISALRFLNNTGSARFALFQYQAAIDAFVRARDLARSTGDKISLSTVSANLCSLYMQIGDVASAKRAAEQGLDIPSDVNLSYRSQFFGMLGLLERSLGHHTQALEYFRQGVVAAELHGTDPLRLEAWNHYAQALFHQGDLVNAENAALNAYHIGSLSSVREMRPAYLMLARIYRARGKSELALSLVENGLAVPVRRSDRQLWSMYFLYERAMIYSVTGRRPEALQDLRLALAYARDWREAIAPSDNLRSGADFWVHGVYDAFIELATHRPGAAADAFLAVEEERSASLMQMLVENGHNRDSNSRYREDLARLRASEIAWIANPSPALLQNTAQVGQRLSEMDALSGAEFVPAKTAFPEGLLSGNTLRKIQRKIAPDEAVVSLHLGESGSFAWALTRDSLEMHHLASRGKLARLAESFRRSVRENAPERDRIGSELYSELFAPMSAAVRQKSSWILASDDSLFEVPFSALVVERKNDRPVFLLEKHELARIPTVLVLMNAHSAPAGPGFLGIGDGIYNRADPRWSRAQDSRKHPLELPRLASSGAELKNCASSCTSRGITLLTGIQATREALRKALAARPAIIHIASHVLYPSGEPELALIHLGLNETGEPQVLTTKDVTGLQAHGALVVLSGCSSAAGNVIRGAGVMGLTRAWLLAGARAVVGSRWPVPDDTGELFSSFYTHLEGSDLSPAALRHALRMARLDMLHSHTWRSEPGYWGAFYLLTKE